MYKFFTTLHKPTLTHSHCTSQPSFTSAPPGTHLFVCMGWTKTELLLFQRHPVLSVCVFLHTCSNNRKMVLNGDKLGETKPFLKVDAFLGIFNTHGLCCCSDHCSSFIFNKPTVGFLNLIKKRRAKR